MHRTIPGVAVVLLVGLTGCTSGAADRSGRAGRTARRNAAKLVLGRSVRGRPIEAAVVGDPRAPHPMLVVGCIHGNESAGIAIADRLAGASVSPRTAIWIVGDLNPDGVAAGTRQNADGVDLNRNFPFEWRPLGRRGDQQYSGPRPLSEPESRIAMRLIAHLRPRITIWFHQPLALIDRSGGNAGVEARFAELAGLPLKRLVRYPGSVATWENHQGWGGTAFVVELRAGRLEAAAVRRYARAVIALAGAPTSASAG